MITAVGKARVISNFALTHFGAAMRFSEHARNIETANAANEFGPFFADLSAYCAGCVVISAASLEALINELFIHPGPLQNSVPDFESFFWGGTETRRRYFFFKKQKIIRGIERDSALKKYKNAVRLLGKKPLSRLDVPYENAEALFGLRNYLIHFKPLWDENKRNTDLEDALDGRFEISPFVDEGADFVSKKCMSASCASWATDTVVNFVNYFAERSELDPKKLGAFDSVRRGPA